MPLFKNYDMNPLCGIKGIKREFSNARTPQQNGGIITILNTLDHLGKFDGKADEGFLVGYSINSKAFRVLNSRTRKVEENLAGNRTNGNAGLETNSDAGQAGKENVPDQDYILLPFLHTSSNVPSNSEKDESSPKDDARTKNEVKDSAKEGNMNGLEEATNTNRLNTISSPVNTVSSSFTTVDPRRVKEQRNEYESLFDPLIPDLEDTVNFQDSGIFGNAYDDEYVGAQADLINLETNMNTRRMHKQNEAGLISFINKQRRTNHKDFQNCLFACFLSQMELKKTLVDLPHGKKVIGTKWVFRNKRDQRGIVVRNKSTLVAQGYRQEEGVDYDEVFAPVVRIKAI
ncbi:putative ribonuclease H-like domain-containing protein, partial [Tanacetum coccineum]